MPMMYQHDPDLGYMPAIPEPFWLKKWWWLSHRPHCHRCNLTFKTRTQWNLHYLDKHLAEDERGN